MPGWIPFSPCRGVGSSKIRNSRSTAQAIFSAMCFGCRISGEKHSNKKYRFLLQRDKMPRYRLDFIGVYIGSQPAFLLFIPLE